MPSNLEHWLLLHTPAWYRTPLMQTVALGLVFFFVFASYSTIQFYARTTYGEQLAANSVAAVYLTFTLACGMAPSVTNRWGCRQTMLLGIIGYAVLVASSLLYFIFGIEWVVVAGGAVLGVGAALLWTAQGRLVLDYAAVEGGTGTLMGVFWAVFQCSSLVGGAVSFVYYSQKPTGSVWLYLIFLLFIVMGALSTQLLLPPTMLKTPHKRNVEVEEATSSDDPIVQGNKSSLSEETHLLGLHLQIEEYTPTNNSWTYETRQTLKIFGTKPMLILSTLFFYTGFNQPYQQSTFGNRFFNKRTIGVELIVFHLMEIVGAIYCGRALDGRFEKGGRPRSAVLCLALFIAVNTTGNVLAIYQEFSRTITAVDISDVHSVLPSLAFACWGFADSQIQVYSYWLIGALYETGDDHSRAFGFYKCMQSLGVSVGFFLTPLTRLSALQQLILSSCVYVVGTALAFLRLPS